MNKILKRTIIIVLTIILVLILIIGAYVAYLSFNYERIEDNTELEVYNNNDIAVYTDTEYSILTYNIGFGAYDQDYSFFMDKGTMSDGTETTGEFARAQSKQIVQSNTDGVIDLAKSEDADFMFFQEVDKDSTRSFHINQAENITDEFPDYVSVYASNFHSVYLAYPLHEPHGSVEAGLLTLSEYHIASAVRRSFPVDDHFILKFFDLDRCFTVHRVPVDSDGPGDGDADDTGELVIINVHMSAYDEGGVIREEQMEMLMGVLADEYTAGNWVIVGGDFNHVIDGNIEAFMGEQEVPNWVQPFAASMLPTGFSVVEATNKNEVATVRASDIPYEKGINYLTTLDGFIVSDNIEASSTNIETEYMYSDHNPVLLKFQLKLK